MERQRNTTRWATTSRLLACALGGTLCAAAGSLRADAPLGHYTIAADTVFDNRTRLTWQRAVPGQAYTQSSGISYCSTLSLAGMTGWRLPTVLELQSLVDDTRAAPAIDPAAFPNTPSTQFWSASIPGSGNGWYVNFNKGDSGGQPGSQQFRVRCVRT